MTEPTKTLLLELRHPGRLSPVDVTELREGDEGFEETMADLGWIRREHARDAVAGDVALKMANDLERMKDRVDAELFGEGANGHPVKGGEAATGDVEWHEGKLISERARELLAETGITMYQASPMVDALVRALDERLGRG